MPKHTLYLIRHALPEKRSATGRDIDRGLNAVGKMQAAALGAYFKDHGITPDAILCSTATRTRETLAGLELENTDPIYIHDLYLPPVETLNKIIMMDTPDDAAHIVVVSHFPGVYEYASARCKDTATLNNGFVEGSMAIFEGDIAAQDLELTHYISGNSLQP